MDGRVQEPVIEYGQKAFGAKYPDTITEAGLVGHLEKFRESIEAKLKISLEKHHSRGIVIHGHQECAALDAVDDKTHRNDVLKTAQKVDELVNKAVPVHGVFVTRNNKGVWIAEKVYP